MAHFKAIVQRATRYVNHTLFLRMLVAVCTAQGDLERDFGQFSAHFEVNRAAK